MNLLPQVGDYRFTEAGLGITINAGGFVFQTDPGKVDFLLEVVNNLSVWTITSCTAITIFRFPMGSRSNILAGSWTILPRMRCGATRYRRDLRLCRAGTRWLDWTWWVKIQLRVISTLFVRT